ncbi:hypothetical protein GALMADRAFT_136454 [Galerina marginata CBS 339.88]|uniref:Uncharacterized protein n=1 Tax=Galerina marginata (strain CBS 339.88) TaxID=685588 RepID=A0A067TLN6_GALM3|nr:hypothetical protein GALMADRAFT_136454 [Galerina marginata CBS 339.88]
MLPNISMNPLSLDAAKDDEIKINQMVRVRQFNQETRAWTQWELGLVVDHVKLTCLLGAHGRGYKVACPSSDCLPMRKVYSPCLGEISALEAPSRKFNQYTPQEVIFARVKDDRIMFSSVKLSDIVIEASVIRWENGNLPEVIALTTSVKGRKFDTIEVFPYSPETALTCQLRGNYVSLSREDKPEDDILPPINPLHRAAIAREVSAYKDIGCSGHVLALVISDIENGRYRRI